MKKTESPNQEQFDALLAWLDPDRDRAGAKYEEIRRALIEYFACRKGPDPEALTDEVFDGVALNLPEIKTTSCADPMLHFYAEAKSVYRRKVVMFRPCHRANAAELPIAIDAVRSAAASLLMLKAAS